MGCGLFSNNFIVEPISFWWNFWAHRFIFVMTIKICWCLHFPISNIQMIFLIDSCFKCVPLHEEGKGSKGKEMLCMWVNAKWVGWVEKNSIRNQHIFFSLVRIKRVITFNRNYIGSITLFGRSKQKFIVSTKVEIKAILVPTNLHCNALGPDIYHWLCIEKYACMV